MFQLTAKIQIFSDKTWEFDRNALSVHQLIDNNPDRFIRRHRRTTLGKARSTIAKQMGNLQKAGIIRRVGPDKGGYWEVIE